ncbi:helix-turn-helix domain-containing protein [Streptomyces sp. NPDC058525]|uniref:helix-turn-helix domain-containing protein n=1 Tax=Streptomyces sp. NPDC058525 TaxID=3346538 RepID=UPI003652AD08
MTQRGFDDEDEDDLPEWVDQVMATVAREVRRRRKELGMSAQELADACEEIGHRIPRNVIANMESGRRASLPLVDVMVLAKALHTSPICLIYPVGYIERVQKLPLRDSVQTWDAMRWFTGDEPDSLTLDLMLRMFQEHESEQRALSAAESSEQHEAWKAKSASNATQREEALSAQAFYAERAALAKQRLRRVRASIREEGGTPPLLMPRFTSPFDDDYQEEDI